MDKLLVMTKERWRELIKSEDTWPTCFLSVEQVRAAMTEVDLESEAAIVSARMVDHPGGPLFGDGVRALVEHLLAHMEGK